MTVSLVRRCYETETRAIELEEIFDAILTGAHDLKERDTQIKNRYESELVLTGSVEKAKKAVAELKMELPGVIYSGLIPDRSTGNVTDYTGLLMADVDNLGEEKARELKETMKVLPFVRACGISPTGTGLKVLFNVTPDPARHGDSFRAIQQNFRDSFGVEIDEKCKDITRLHFLFYDPNFWIRIEGNEILPPADPLPRSKPVLTSADVSMPAREQIAFRLLGELRPAPEKGGYFVRCPGVEFHDNKTGDKHTIVYLEGAPNVHCQHESCHHVVKAFNAVLQSEIGKAEFRPPPVAGVNGQEEVTSEVEWNEALIKGFVTTTDFPTITITPRKKLLGEWFREGDLGYIFGFRGVAKTWFALGMSTALATNGKFGEWPAHELTQVAYLDTEMPAEDIRSRVIGLGLSDNFHILNHEVLFERTGKVVNVNNLTIQKAISQYCVQNHIQVLIIDNLSTAAYGMRENEADSWEQMNRWLLELRRAKIAVIIIHHAGRGGNMRGTSKREDAAFWIIQLDDIKKDSDDREGARFISRFPKASRNTQKDVPSYEWHFFTDPTGEVIIKCKLSEGLTVFHAVIESGVTKPSEIAKVMGIQDYQVSRLAKKAIDQGWLERASRGEYRLKEAEK